MKVSEKDMNIGLAGEGIYTNIISLLLEAIHLFSTVLKRCCKKNY